jgi:glycosyltransferase involved in cell wall biosynthesis
MKTESLLDLTIAIPVRNEEKNLGKCLEAIGNDLAKKVVIIDSGSTDNTKIIAQEAGVDLIDFTWNGKFPKKRNWYLRNHRPTTKWILFLDADEYLTDDFKKEIRQALKNEQFVGYWLSYTIYFMGKINKGGYPLRKLALFQVGFGEYENIAEEKWSNFDMEIHEHPVLQGPVGTLKSKIRHEDFRDITHYVAKHQEYASWEAFRYLKTLNDNVQQQSWTWKQKLKYRLMRTVWIGPIYFLGSYILLGGFRDGARGLSFAIHKMSYFNLVYCKIKELKL